MGLLSRRTTPNEPSNSTLAAGAALLLLVIVVAVTAVQWHISQRTEAYVDEVILGVTQAFEQVPPFTNADAAALRQYPNRVHVERAQQLGFPRIPDRAAAEELLESTSLVELQDSDYYITIDLGYSIPYVIEDAAHLLDIIGRRFQQRLRQNGLPPYRFVVTSATRTDDDQRRLRRVNTNAAENSSHFHGTTVDIHYRRFDYDVSVDSLPEEPGFSRPMIEERFQSTFTKFAETYQPQLKSILGEVMKEVQSEELVMVTYERLQPVYHITVNQRISGGEDVDAVTASVTTSS